MAYPWVCSRVLLEGDQDHSAPEPKGTLAGEWSACKPLPGESLLFFSEKPSPHQRFALLQAAGMGC